MDRKIDEEEIVDDVVTLLESTLSPRNIARGFRLFLSEVSRSLPTINTSNVDNKKILSFALKGTVWEWDIILILWNLSKRIEVQSSFCVQFCSLQSYTCVSFLITN
jgi:hypothetical protein